MPLRYVIVFAIIGVLLLPALENTFAETIKVSIPKGTSVPGCEIKSLCYIPDPISVSVGDVVEWTNRDSVSHTVSSGSPKTGADGILYSGLMQADKVFAFSFDESGSFPYFCTIHPWMEGLIIVNPPLLKSVKSTDITEMRLSKSGSIIVTIQTDIPKARTALPIDLTFTNENSVPLSHINYDVRVIQDNEDVLLIENAHSVDGAVELPAKILESDNSVEIIVGLRGIYLASQPVKPVYETIEILISDETPVTKGVSPKAQTQRGVHSQDVICRQDFELIKKNSDSSPACVSSESIEKLLARGWGSLFKTK
jgi:plastocyanin